MQGRSSWTLEDLEEDISALLQDHFHSLRSAFSRMDRDGDGTLSHDEFRRGLRNLSANISEAQIDGLLRRLDPLKREKISFGKFVDRFSALMKAKQKNDWEAIEADIKVRLRAHFGSLREAFLSFDENEDGVLTAAEFRRGLARIDHGLSDSQVSDLMRRLDRNGSGQVNYVEFLKKFGDVHVDPKRAVGGTWKWEDIETDVRNKLRDSFASLRSAFDAFDKDGDGKVSFKEFKDGLNKLQLGLSHSQVMGEKEEEGGERGKDIFLFQRIFFVLFPIFFKKQFTLRILNQ